MPEQDDEADELEEAEVIVRMIDPEALQEIKAICKFQYNQELTDSEAIEIAERIVRYLRATSAFKKMRQQDRRERTHQLFYIL
jgi:hypothetical protein